MTAKACGCGAHVSTFESNRFTGGRTRRAALDHPTPVEQQLDLNEQVLGGRKFRRVHTLKGAESRSRLGSEPRCGRRAMRCEGLVRTTSIG
jgi:hypothetical protein